MIYYPAQFGYLNISIRHWTVRGSHRAPPCRLKSDYPSHPTSDAQMNTVATTSHISAAKTRQPLQGPQLTAKDQNDNVPSKKQRVNHPRNKLEKERTSNYSFNDGTSGDEDNFTQITKRKHRPAGVPLMIKPQKTGNRFSENQP